MESCVDTITGHTLCYSTPAQELESLKHCKLSLTKGKRVLQQTIANHLKEEHWNILDGRQFYFCEEQACPVVYFENTGDIYVSLDEVKSKVTHKMEIGSDSRPLCYCKNVLESRVLDELLVRHCCDSIKDIQEYTGANTGKNCSITNPSGRCCGSEIKKVLDWAKERRGDINMVTYKEAVSCCKQIEENTGHLEID